LSKIQHPATPLSTQTFAANSPWTQEKVKPKEVEDKDCFAGQARQHHLADHGSGLSDLGSLGGWKMTVSWTKSYHEDGRFVRQEHGGWSTGWVNFYERYKTSSDVPAIWKDFGDKPFEESAVSLPISNFPKDLTLRTGTWLRTLRPRTARPS
jgi:hypothetical protein